MSCFNNRSYSNIYEPCCSSNTLCHFDGNLDEVYSVPVYTQRVYDAVQFNLQGMKTLQQQTFTPALPCGTTIARVADIRARAFFNPCNTEDSRNLTVEMDTSLSGASFLKDCHGNAVEVIGPDGTYSQKILYPDNTCCEEDCKGNPVFGTQNVYISGNVTVYLDLILCGHCNHETCYTVSAEVPIATPARPMTLTNFFEICMPAGTDHAFLPRFTELTSVACEARLATNNCCRDLLVNAEGEVSGNLLVALCVNAEKKVIAPAQMCVLSTGMVDVPSQSNSICSGFPSMFAGGITPADTRESCGCGCDNDYDYGLHHSDDCGHYEHIHHDDCGCNHDTYTNGCGHEPHTAGCGCTDDCGCGENRSGSRGCR